MDKEDVVHIYIGIFLFSLKKFFFIFGCIVSSLLHAGFSLVVGSGVEYYSSLWCTVEYYSAIKRNKIELFVVRWMDLESVIQSEVSQKEKNKYRILMHIYGV